jgi:hypothetical protein
MAAGKVAGVNPEVWKIIDGKLYLSWDNSSMDTFQKNAVAYIEKADENWAKLRSKN